MKHKRSLTLSETALLVCDIKSRALNMKIIIQMMTKWASDNIEILDKAPTASALTQLKNIRKPESSLPEDVAFFDDVIDIYMELSFDAMDLTRKKPISKTQILEIDYCILKKVDEREIVDIERSTFTRYSLAQWFYEVGDLGRANILVPNFSPEPKENPKQVSNIEQQIKELQEENQRVSEYCKKLLLDSEQLIERLVDQDFKKPKEAECLELNLTQLSEYLPVSGKEMGILYKAFQSFPSRFEDYKVRSYDKKTVMEWLWEAYKCRDRQQFVYADILIQHFFDSK